MVPEVARRPPIDPPVKDAHACMFGQTFSYNRVA